MTIKCDNKECIYNDGFICECDYVEMDAFGCCETDKRRENVLMDRCYECTGYGDDYIWDAEAGEYVSACKDCPFNGKDEEEDE